MPNMLTTPKATGRMSYGQMRHKLNFSQRHNSSLFTEGQIKYQKKSTVSTVKHGGDCHVWGCIMHRVF